MNSPITGRLTYLVWDRPWIVETDGGHTVDFKPLFWAFVDRHRDKLCSHDETRTSYELKADDASEYALEAGPVDTDVSLFMTEGRFGFSNVAAYLEGALCRLNGRHILIEAGDTSFKVSAAPCHEVFGVKYHGEGNYAQIPEGKERELCKVGQADCCLFLVGSADGFECAKFSGYTARMLLSRKAEGTIRATRIGDCEILGRVE